MNGSNPPIDIKAEIDRFFDGSSVATAAQPRAVIFAGGPATGKTTLRRAQYSTGYVVLDAAEIFLDLCRGQYFDFPGPFEELMDLIGLGISQRIFLERRNFVFEIIAAELEPTTLLMETIVNAGFLIDFRAITCDLEESYKAECKSGQR